MQSYDTIRIQEPEAQVRGVNDQSTRSSRLSKMGNYSYLHKNIKLKVFRGKIFLYIYLVVRKTDLRHFFKST